MTTTASPIRLQRTLMETAKATISWCFPKGTLTTDMPRGSHDAIQPPFADEGDEDSPIWLWRIPSGSRRLVFKRPVVLSVVRDQDEPDLLRVDTPPPLDLHLAAATRVELIAELHQELLFLWDEYARADEQTLARRARTLRSFLLDIIEEQHA